MVDVKINKTKITGTVTANAGTNLNTSALALEATLTLVKAKTDNLDTALSGIKTGTDKIPASPATEGGNLTTIAGDTTSIDGKITACNTGAVVVSSGSITETNSASIKTAVEARVATTPTVYNVTMTLANTEYSQALPAGTKILEFRCQDTGYAIRFAYETGKVATLTSPYRSLSAGEAKTLDGLNLTSKILYFACSTAGQILEIEAWV